MKPFLNAKFVISAEKLSQCPELKLPEFPLLGRSNVGKSTLINKLLNRKALARVSSVPGKTATINFYRTDHVYLVDLPGYGYAKTSKSEQERLRKLIVGYLRADRDLRLVVQLVDMRHAPSAEDVQMINAMIDGEIPFIIAFTKADKLRSRERAERMSAFESEIPCFKDIISVVTSSESGEGMETLRELIDEAVHDGEV